MGIMCRPPGNMYFLMNFSIRALKLVANREKQVFTFFGFLPPYIGVSGSLVSRMRKISMRSIDWYRKFLISCLAARYSAVFVFVIVKIGFLKLNLLSNRAVESFWDALWLGIRPFLCFCLVRGSCARVLCTSLVRRLVRPKQIILPNTVISKHANPPIHTKSKIS